MVAVSEQNGDALNRVGSWMVGQLEHRHDATLRSTAVTTGVHNTLHVLRQKHVRLGMSQHGPGGKTVNMVQVVHTVKS